MEKFKHMLYSTTNTRSPFNPIDLNSSDLKDVSKVENKELKNQPPESIPAFSHKRKVSVIDSQDTTVVKRKKTVSIVPELTSLSSSEVPNLDSYAPNPSEEFGFSINLTFDLKELGGQTHYKTTLCTVNWLMKKLDESEDVFNCHNHLVIKRYDFKELKDFIIDHLKSCARKTAPAVDYKLSQIAERVPSDYIERRRASFSEMIPELESLNSIDIENLESYVPNDPNYFGFLLDLEFKLKNGEKLDPFRTFVGSKTWLKELIGSYNDYPPIFNCNHYLIMKSYNFNKLKDYIAKNASHCFASNEEEVCYQLSRIAKWEFEDYEGSSENESE